MFRHLPSDGSTNFFDDFRKIIRRSDTNAPLLMTTAAATTLAMATSQTLWTLAGV